MWKVLLHRQDVSTWEPFTPFPCVQSRRATAEELLEYPARLSLTDAIKHISWVAENYDALEQEFPNHPWNAVMVQLSPLPSRCINNPLAMPSSAQVDVLDAAG